MIKTILVENTPTAIEQLRLNIGDVSSEIEVQAGLVSVTEATDYLLKKVPPHLIISAIELTDGLFFEVIAKTGTTAPVIYIGQDDGYKSRVFQFNGIYFLKSPVSKLKLAKAVEKFQSLRNYFLGEKDKLPKSNESKRLRIVVEKGDEHISLPLADVALFYKTAKTVYIIDKIGSTYEINTTLSKIEAVLDRNMFFRANRQYIVNINYVKGFTSYEQVKLKVAFTISEIKELIIISQETAPLFKKWLQDS